MDIKGTHRFHAPRDKVWGALLDPTILAQALPGGEELTKVGENEYSAAMKVSVGPVQGKFTGKIQLTDIEPPSGYTMQVDGSGNAGFVQGVGKLNLEEDGDETLVTYAGEVQVGGRIASVGQRLVESTAKSLIRQGLRALDAQFEQPADPPQAKVVSQPEPSAPAAPKSENTSPDPTVNTSPPSQSHPSAQNSQVGQATAPSAMSIAAEVAKDVARDIASEYVSPSKQERFVFALLGASLMLLFVILVRLVQRN